MALVLAPLVLAGGSHLFYMPELFGRFGLKDILLSGVWGSLQIGGGAVLSAILFGAMPACFTHGKAFKGEQLFLSLQLLSLAIPSTLLFSVYRELGLEERISNPFSLGLMLGAQASGLMFLLVNLQLKSIPSDLDDAGKTLGLYPWQRFLRIELPLIVPALAISSFLIMSLAVSDLPTPRLAEVPSIALVLQVQWEATQNGLLVFGVGGLTVLLSCLMILVCGGAVWSRLSLGSELSKPRFLTPSEASLAHSVNILTLLPKLLVPLYVMSKALLGKAIVVDEKLLFAGFLGTFTLGLVALFLIGAWVFLFMMHSPLGRDVNDSSTRWPLLSLINLLTPAAILGVIGLSYWPAAWGVGLSPLVTALFLRYLPLALLPVTLCLSDETARLRDQARVLGHSDWDSRLNVFKGYLLTPLMGASVIIFILITSESTLTLILRPFDVHVLSERIYQAVAIGDFAKAQVWGLILLLLNVIPVWLLSGKLSQGGQYA